jgi:glycosyltransferase involved in cell wall biosynthesis
VLARYAQHVRVISEGPVELSPKLNVGFQAARGEIVGWLGADDLYLPGAIRGAVEALQRFPEAGMVYADFVEIDEDGRELQRIECPEFELETQVNVGDIVPQPTVFMRREALRRVGWVDERYRWVQDYDLWVRIAKQFPLHHIDAYWAAYRRHEGQTTAVNQARVGPELRRASRRHGGRFFSELGFTYSKPLRALRLLRRGQLGTFARKLIRNVARVAPGGRGRRALR